MKVLIVCDRFPPPWNGGDTTVAITFERLLSKIAETAVLTCALPQQSVEDGIFRVLSPKNIWSKDSKSLHTAYAQDKKKIKKVLELTKPDVLFFLHLWGIAGESIRLLDSYNARKIYRFGDECYRIHCIEPADRLRQGWINAPMESLAADRVIVNSQELSNRIRSYTKSTVLVVHNHLNFRGNPSPSPSGMNLCFVGRIVPHKGVETCLKIAQQLKAINYDFSLKIVGSGYQSGYGAELRDRYIDMEKLNLVEWTGSLPHAKVREAIELSKYILFPSRRRSQNKTIEGCPNTIIEAWASKRMVLANSYAGHGEFLSHKKNSWIIDSDSSHTWIENLFLCEKQSDVCRKITSTAFKNVFANHNEETLKTILQNLLEALRL